METVGDYELEEILGAGMSGTVWRARRRGPLPRTVALKRAGQRARDTTGAVAAQEQLRAEATLLADLDHPHIVDVLDILDEGDGVAIVMQLAQGGSLRALLDERRTLTPGQVVAVVAPIADALASAHRRGLVHGDVKPANILFTRDGEPLLSDFGAARHLGAPVASGASVIGTAPYLDPLLLEGTAPDTTNDVYALGIICYEALLGELSHVGPTDDALSRLTALRSVPESLTDLVEGAISRTADLRPPNMEDFAERLRASVDPASVQLPGTPAGGAAVDRAGSHGTRLFGPRPPTPELRDERPVRRGTVATVLLCTLVVVSAGVGAAWLRRTIDDTPAETRTAAAPASRPATCPAFPQLDGATGVKRFRVDVNGDDCPVPVVWDGQVMSARFDPSERTPRQYEIGSRGDVLLFGDWDCDGSETPALYRPEAGEVVYVNSFAAEVGDRTYAERIARRLPRRGSARVHGVKGGCHVVLVDRPRS